MIRILKTAFQTRARLARNVASGLTVCAAMYGLSQPATAQRYCAVKDGYIADVASGAFSPSTRTVTLKSTYKAEFRWDINHKEALGWMRITDGSGAEIGWVPAGHDAVVCGNGN